MLVVVLVLLLVVAGVVVCGWRWCVDALPMRVCMQPPCVDHHWDSLWCVCVVACVDGGWGKRIRAWADLRPRHHWKVSALRRSPDGHRGLGAATRETRLHPSFQQLKPMGYTQPLGLVEPHVASGCAKGAKQGGRLTSPRIMRQT